MKSTDIEQLYKEYRPALLRRLMSLVRCEETAADLAQDAYVKLARLPASQLLTNPRAFLFRIANNLALDHFRREKLRRNGQSPMEDALEVPALAPSAEDQLYDKQRMATIEKALATVSVYTRAVFVLRRVHECSYKEIAGRLGITERAVERHLKKATTRCHEALLRNEKIVEDQRGGTHPPDAFIRSRVE